MVAFSRVLMPMLRSLRTQVLAECGEFGDTVLKHYGFVPAGAYWRLAPEGERLRCKRISS